MLLSNMISGIIAIELGALGPNFGTSSSQTNAEDWPLSTRLLCLPADSPADQPAPLTGVNSACAAATHALGIAYTSIATGEADVMIAGGSEAAVTPFGYAGFCSMKAMCTKFNDNPTKVRSRYRHADCEGAVRLLGESRG